MGAGEGAAIPAAVGEALGEEFFPDPGGELGAAGVLAETVVLDGQEVVVVHYFHEMGGAGPAHFALFVIFVEDFAVQFETEALDGGRVGGMVVVLGKGRVAADKGLEALVPEDGADASAPGLLHAAAAAAPIVEAEIEEAEQAVLGAAAGGYH